MMAGWLLTVSNSDTETISVLSSENSIPLHQKRFQNSHLPPEHIRHYSGVIDSEVNHSRSE